VDALIGMLLIAVFEVPGMAVLTGFKAGIVLWNGGLILVGFLCEYLVFISCSVRHVLLCRRDSSGGTEMESFFLEGCVDGPLKSFYCKLRDHRYYHFDPIFSLMLHRQ